MQSKLVLRLYSTYYRKAVSNNLINAGDVQMYLSKWIRYRDIVQMMEIERMCWRFPQSRKFP